jgi:hypothetical protein
MAKTATYSLIASNTVTGSVASSITFSSIPATFTDLILVGSVKFNNTNGEAVWMQFNSDTATNYSRTQLEGYTTPPPSGRASNETKLVMYSASNANFVPYLINILDYSNATTYKTTLFRTSDVGNPVAGVGLWRATPAAINTILLTMNTSANSFAIGTTFKVYGIQAGSN